MELEDSISILKGTIGEFKFLQSTLNEDEKELYEHGIQSKEIQAIHTLLNALENSIPKKKIENEMEKLEENGYWHFLENRDLELTQKILQDLLEDK